MLDEPLPAGTTSLYLLAHSVWLSRDFATMSVVSGIIR